MGITRYVGPEDFIKAFADYGRETQFSNAGLYALYSYLEDLSDSCGEDIELDVIAICCDYSEWGDIFEYAGEVSEDREWLDQEIDTYLEELRAEDNENAGWDDLPTDIQEDIRLRFIERLQDYRTVIDVDGERIITSG